MERLLWFDVSYLPSSVAPVVYCLLVFVVFLININTNHQKLEYCHFLPVEYLTDFIQDAMHVEFCVSALVCTMHTYACVHKIKYGVKLVNPNVYIQNYHKILFYRQCVTNCKMPCLAAVFMLSQSVNQVRTAHATSKVYFECYLSATCKVYFPFKDCLCWDSQISYKLSACLKWEAGLKIQVHAQINKQHSRDIGFTVVLLKSFFMDSKMAGY